MRTKAEIQMEMDRLREELKAAPAEYEVGDKYTVEVEVVDVDSEGVTIKLGEEEESYLYYSEFKKILSKFPF
jgi:ribosomal protein S1